MKLNLLAEATSNFGDIDFYYTDEDILTQPESQSPPEFHSDDDFERPQLRISQIYKFGDGTKFYLYNGQYNETDPIIAGLTPSDDPPWYEGCIVIDKLGQKRQYKTMDAFRTDWGHYIDAIIGAYDTKPFGPQEVAEFRQVFNL